MSDRSKIEWCDTTWNPITGCTKISQGCKNCYASELHNRRHKAYLAGAKLPAQYAKPFETVQLHPERLEMPLHWKKPRRVFVNSMSDLFHPNVPDYFIGMVFAVMALAPHHTFMILTKRPERMEKIFKRSSGEFWGTVRVNLLRKGYPLPDDETAIHPLPNVWLGVSVENADHLDRIDLLRRNHAAVRFISFEPLLGPVDNVDLTGIQWVIVGGESGPNARPMHPDWARSIRDQCQAAGVKFFFKQWGEWYPSPYQGRHTDHAGFKFDKPTNTIRVGKKAAGRLLDGREWNEYPEAGA